MTVDRADDAEENVERPPAPDRQPPSDRPGTDGVPSRADSRDGAVRASEPASDTATDDRPGDEERDERPKAKRPADEPDDEPDDEGAKADEAPAKRARPEADAEPPANDAPSTRLKDDDAQTGEAAFWVSSPDAGQETGTVENQDRPDHPQVTDRSDYVLTDREYAFAGISPQQAWDMHEQRAPLGTEPDQWNDCVAELQEALAADGITDADVRLKGPAARFCDENPKKWFPQSEDDVRAKVSDHYRNAPASERAARADNAAATYRAGGFSEERPKPAAPFFDSMHKLDATNDLSPYDFQLSSDGLAERFRQLEKADGGRGGHYTHRHLEQVAPALHEWAGRWEATLGREVTIATFDRHGPATGLDDGDDDWHVIDPEEQK